MDRRNVTPSNQTPFSVANPNGESRIRELRSFDIVDTPAEDAFDEITFLATVVAGTPVAYITFVDEETLWFKSTRGFSSEAIPREKSYCQYVVAREERLVIEDTRRDQRFRVSRDGKIAPAQGERGVSPDMPEDEPTRVALPGPFPVVFYAGIPLMSPDEQVLGTLCVVDRKPRKITDRQIRSLEALARQVVKLLELRRSNIRLRAEQEMLETLFDVAPIPLVLLADDAIVRSNFAFAALASEGSVDDVIGSPIVEYLADVPETTSETVDTTLLTEARETVPVAVNKTRLRINRKEFMLLAIADITDRREKERVLGEQRIQAENVARIKDTFLTMLSHDLKSPLAGVLSMLDLLAGSSTSFSAEDRTQAITTLRSTIALMVEMINQLLNIHRLESGQMQLECRRVPVTHLVQNVELSLQKQVQDKQIEIVTRFHADYTLNVDEGLYREALFNLVSNAIKFSPLGGRITIDGSGNDVRVSDEGGGIDPRDIPDLFRHEVKTSRLGTAGEGGTGLGLPLVKDIMLAHGGEVLVDHTGPDGTCFVLRVPGE